MNASPVKLTKQLRRLRARQLWGAIGPSLVPFLIHILWKEKRKVCWGGEDLGRNTGMNHLEMLWDLQQEQKNTFVHLVNIYWVPPVSQLCPGAGHLKTWGRQVWPMQSRSLWKGWEERDETRKWVLYCRNECLNGNLSQGQKEPSGATLEMCWKQQDLVCVAWSPSGVLPGLLWPLPLSQTKTKSEGK